MPRGGARAGAGRTRTRRKLSTAAAKRLDAELAWLTEDVQDEVLSALIERAPRDWWAVAFDVAREMGLDKDGRIPDETGKPIII